MDGGEQGGNGALLASAEFDGYLQLKDGKDQIHLAWRVMPHRSADVHTVTRNVFIPKKAFGLLAMVNLSKSLPGAFDIFDLKGTSGKLPRSVIEENQNNEITLHDISAIGVRTGDGLIRFTVNLYGRRAHPAYPRGIEVDIDTNMDGTPDYFVSNTELSGFDVTGQTVVAVPKAGQSTSNIYFYADADLNSGSMILTAPLAAMGLTANSKFSFDVDAYNSYFTGLVGDQVLGSVYTVSVPLYIVTSDAALPCGWRADSQWAAAEGG